jgi:hypothetical protein
MRIIPSDNQEHRFATIQLEPTDRVVINRLKDTLFGAHIDRIFSRSQIAVQGNNVLTRNPSDLFIHPIEK